MSMAEQFEDDGAEPSREQLARAAGWRPFSEWRREPEDWKDIEEYLAVVEEEFPVARETARRLTKNNARLERKIEEQTQQIVTMQTQMMDQIRQMGEATRTADRRAYERARADLIAQRDGAVEAGDKPTFDQLEQQLRELDQGAPPAAAPPPPAPPPADANAVPAEERRVLQEWVDDNPWYMADQRLKRAMIAHHSAVRQTKPNMRLADQLALAKARVAEDFPGEDLGQEEELEPLADDPPPARAAAPQRRVPPAVSRPSGNAPPPRRATVWDQITDASERTEVQRQFERFKALNNDPDMPASEYVTIYLDPHADAIALRRARKKA